ncbi:hypothetical protein [Flavobacterium johnsoniae]|uniref:Uncharacterized protein n=1 Tax=Flavobacterium johnsoniae (strain ATCC 17061 / DSM 2064 / JCM 8514 / BCRC 14874 / CCUG 350202 / NBRC 14942 / NCIMB 11054 / UW101) TaxID=376686 RepID=A5FBP5_FLAJ1|nr:hypothetical protein [Flavobacterium johnsoniae]ABQ07378.1 hypothetical protein Fjoh_4371 [Flavobacterium johnsoniae UW101]OXE99291.1 hypothetical protein B0A63_11910 [Flavobacterium johnsoniae UW101]WQG80786.1 hypothetical protein SR927_22565 [Flavobacterium johnsoniae UW101]SHL14737.1 hypothetical protein SAMN05444146_3128 [Flavobacterium johnsoniae]
MNKILFLLIFISQTSISQTLNDLDLKNGFRHFKFGSSPSLIKNIVKQENQAFQNPNVVVYDYVGTDINNIYNEKVESISLIFFKNKLFNICVNFGDFETSDFKRILYALEKTYGKKWVEPTNKESIILNGAIWAGKNVVLELFKMDSLYNGGYINVYDIKLTNAMFSSDF